MTTSSTLTKTEQVISDMLLENTGIHMLDSGGDNGRAWQRNRALIAQYDSFKNAKHATLCGRYGIEYTTNIFHYLTEHLEYDEAMDSIFQSFRNGCIELGNSDISIMDEFAKEFRNGRGLYGEGDPITLNTYEVDGCKLSQVIQFVQWHDPYDDNEYILLQIHGGADIRGGYTSPVCFTESGRSEYPLLCTSDGYIGCSKCEAKWYCDGPYWTSDNCDIDLNDLCPTDTEVITGAAEYRYCEDTGDIFCPVCDSGKLVV
jgi:hypothetical protein